MGGRRVDRIAQALEQAGGRSRLSDVVNEVRQLEGNTSVTYTAIYIAIQAENDRLESLGARPKFRTSRQGEERGWVSLEGSSDFPTGTAAQRIESQILQANEKVDDENLPADRRLRLGQAPGGETPMRLRTSWA